MKQADVVIGNEYYTNVSGNRVIVKVIRETLVEVGRYARSPRTVTKYIVLARGSVNTLPKARTAAALHPVESKPTVSAEDLAAADILDAL